MFLTLSYGSKIVGKYYHKYNPFFELIDKH